MERSSRRSSVRANRRPRVSYREPNDGNRSESSSEEEEERGGEDGEEFGSSQTGSGQNEQEDGEEQEDELPVPPRKKRGRSTSTAPSTTTSSVKGRGSKKAQISLSSLLSLPLDVLASIFEKMDLQTLFYTSRLNKRLHSFLYQKSMKGVWDEAWKNSELPADTPFDRGLNVLGHANLLFGDCWFCGIKTVNVDCYLRIKACQQKCWKEQTIHQSKLTQEQIELIPWVTSHTPQNGRHNKPYYRLADFQAALDAREANRKYTLAIETDGEGVTNPYVFHTHYHYGLMRSADVMKNIELCVSLAQHEGDILEAWIAEQKKKEIEAKSQVNKDRIIEIKRRFVEYGFEGRHFDATVLAHKVSRAARPLTDKQWPSVRAALLPLLTTARARIREQDLEPMRQRRLELLETDYLRLRLDPKAAKAAGLFPLSDWEHYKQLPSFPEMWHPADAQVNATTFRDNGITLATELNLVKQALAPSFYGMLQLLLQIMQDTDADLMLQRSLFGNRRLGDTVDAAGQLEILALNSAIFRCKDCDFSSPFPSILNHLCRSQQPAPLSSSSYMYDLRSAMASGELYRFVETSQGRQTKDLVVPCSVLEDLGRGFSCLKCTFPTFRDLACDWIGMLNHLKKDHKESHRIEKDSIVLESPADAQLRLLAAHDEWHSIQQGTSI